MVPRYPQLVALSNRTSRLSEVHPFVVCGIRTLRFCSAGKTNISESIQSIKSRGFIHCEEFEQLVVKDGVPVNGSKSGNGTICVLPRLSFPMPDNESYGQPMENKGKYSSLVCLNRKAAVGALMEYPTDIYTFPRICRCCLPAFENDDVSKFSSNFSKATKMREQAHSGSGSGSIIDGAQKQYRTEMIALWKLQEQSIELLEDVTLVYAPK